MSVSERRRQQNAEAQAKRRAKVKQQAEVNQPAETPTNASPVGPAIADALQASTVHTRPAAALCSASEYVRAGQIAGHLEMLFRTGGDLPVNEDAAWDWLDGHAVGASIVLELLAVAGVSESFNRWRGAR